MSQYEHAVLSWFVTPFAHPFTSNAMRMLDPTTPLGAQQMDQIIQRQASIIGYGDAFKALMISSIPCLFLLFLMRKPKVPPKPADPGEAHVAMD